jgi:hypothetical protein
MLRRDKLQFKIMVIVYVGSFLAFRHGITCVYVPHFPRNEQTDHLSLEALWDNLIEKSV